ncbi:MAG: tRNA (adenosine(37)-N6)-threonylcarbamoyltransferase complex transferase subunit TsaD [Puniceicoccales bacterium]|jgi:N6-L-threonylcarbamoyladenine synthase|nr:tRNA (adenosine(37)-N6)-threonylcarbamoyltransferase complex transferase subunit TsaD [Puniceicoccales bacterium]
MRAIKVRMIIGIESSCDESAVAIFDRGIGVVFEEVYSQVALHGEYGGVVPELAVREHVKNFCPLLDDLKARVAPHAVDSIAVTVEPGLPGCLAIGRVAANALSVIWRRPVVGINHLHGHVFSPFIELHGALGSNFIGAFRAHLPNLSLLVSGGNTLLQVVRESGEIELVGGTQDDAAGEAFDKGAKLLGLPYPGGYLVEELAKTGDESRFKWPRAYYDSDEIKFSFSGLKTSLRYFLEKQSDASFGRDRRDICASYQAAIIDVLVRKTCQALTPDIKSLSVCGGVANNNRLRERLADLAQRKGVAFFSPTRPHSGDNAAMIAFAAHVQGIIKA